MSGSHFGAGAVAHFKLDVDVSQVFPYVNAVVEDAVYYDRPHYIRFTLKGTRCALHPDNVAAASFEDREQALKFAEYLIEFLNDLYSRKDSIEPNYKKYKPVPVLDIFKLLPQTNCRECGFSTCMAFAAALSKGTIPPDQCPGINKPIYENAVYPVYGKDGSLASTITLGIDTAKSKLDHKKQKEHIESLEKRLTEITQTNKAISESDKNEIQTGLTAREIEVLRLLAGGATNTEISQILSISPHTVKSHVIHIFNKLGVNDRTQAAVWATRHKLI
jgi:DNA-binding CsgD family transcriptional regulator/ArsR family metal-binding transcriptional regulator